MNAGNQNKLTVARQSPDGELEGRDIAMPRCAEVAGGHGQLVKIGQKAVHYFFLPDILPDAGGWETLMPEIAFCRSSKAFASTI